MQDLFSEDSSLILSAEGPLGILLGLYNPGHTSMGLGVLVHFRWLKLENIRRREHISQAAHFENVKANLDTFLKALYKDSFGRQPPRSDF